MCNCPLSSYMQDKQCFVLTMYLVSVAQLQKKKKSYISDLQQRRNKLVDFVNLILILSQNFVNLILILSPKVQFMILLQTVIS